MEPAKEKAAELRSNAANSAPARVPFGKPMRELFNFAPTYTPLNHGSYGTFPKSVLEYRQQLERDFEARECIYKKFTYPKFLKESRALVAPLLGADTDEVVFVQNATTCINIVLRNCTYQEGDVILHLSSIYPACLKTIWSVGEISPVRPHSVDSDYPIEDEDLVARFKATAQDLQAQGKRVRFAMFDTVILKPGVRLPWEDMVKVCKELGILSLVDGAHGIGHIDLTHTATVGPDFFTSNCHKWLFVPRGCAVLYVPFRNQKYIKTALPTSHGYEPPEVRRNIPESEYFTNLFVDVATADNAPFICLPASIAFREQTCGGEVAIRKYCFNLAKEGGDLVASMLGTEVASNKSGTGRQCCFANVRFLLAFRPGGDVAEQDAQAIVVWLYEKAAEEYDTYLQMKYQSGAIWVRFSAQVYLEIKDFEWAAKTIATLCERVKKGEWREGVKAQRFHVV